MKLLSPGSNEWATVNCGIDASPEEKAAHSELSSCLSSSLRMERLAALIGSGCSVGAGGPSMSDLWTETVGDPTSDLAEEAASQANYNLEGRNIESLLSAVEAAHSVSPSAELEEFAHSTRENILRSCTEFLASANLSVHQEFLLKLTRRRTRDHRLRVFTTNYDLCFEQAASNLGLVVIDGFSFSQPRRYDPRYFEYDIARRASSGSGQWSFIEGAALLFKLHGSVNWTRNSDGSILASSTGNTENACIIYPASGKYQQSFIQPHLETLALFMATLREPNTCVLVSGFGFADSHLAEPVMNACRSNPHFRLIVADPSAEQKTTVDGTYWSELKRLALSRADVWLLEADFAQLTESIPDIKSLGPAEELANAIQRAATQ